MYFKHDETGRILICAIEQLSPDMVWAEPQEGFDPQTMQDWRVERIDPPYETPEGVLIAAELVYDPLLVEVQPSPEERIAALEAQLASYETAYAEGVKDA